MYVERHEFQAPYSFAKLIFQSMIPAALITFREALEATLIVATIIGILMKINARGLIKSVFLGTFSAICSSILLLCLGSLLGLKVHELFKTNFEPLFEGTVMIISAFFITWAVFFLHKTFAHKKLTLISSVQKKISTRNSQTIFFLVFTAVVREGMEIVLFLSTLFFSGTPLQLAGGAIIGLCSAMCIAVIFIRTTIKLPIFYAFRLTSILLILFAAGMLSRGYGELVEAHILPTIPSIPTLTMAFIPQEGILSDLIKTILGLTHEMSVVAVTLWGSYIAIMYWIVFCKKQKAEFHNIP
jgi:high-affinity iron transporter